ncbi:hypothetical protein, partial [Tritonibacter scottomollicae]|uniref:hypothetical protein n=1 Tax=Tritonibacter scottomollicae TaxID=483013 RepID=UPI003AA7B4D1
NLPLNNGIESAMPPAIKEEFFNRISPLWTFVLHLHRMSPPAGRAVSESSLQMRNFVLLARRRTLTFA